MKPSLLPLVVLGAAGFGSAQAQTMHGHGHGHDHVPAHAVHATAAGATTSVADEYTTGEVRKVDLATRKITIKHGEIRNLGMAPMAMVFEAKDPALLEGLQRGDQIRFKAAYENGKYVVTAIERASAK